MAERAPHEAAARAPSTGSPASAVRRDQRALVRRRCVPISVVGAREPAGRRERPTCVYRFATAAITASLLAAACGGHSQVGCNAALANPSLLIDLRAFAATHSDVGGSLCASDTRDPGTREPCATFSLDQAGNASSPSRRIQPGSKAGLLRLFIMPSDDRLMVSLQARGASIGSRSVQLTGHRSSAPCGGFFDSAVIVSASGVPSTR